MPAPTRPFARILQLIRTIVSGLVMLFFGYMLVAVLVQVVGRYFAISIDWAAESATLAQIWMVLLAAGLAMRDQLHVRVEALLHALPATMQKGINLLVMLACLWFLSLAIRGSIDLIAVGMVETSPVLRLPMWIAYLSLPLGLAYFALELVLVFTAATGADTDSADP
ncbi:MAG: TRAP transporter small permease subunit [Kangiellaceae bacterium]|jgi:C4-dicarboxylate transporter DctQ subunit|nr:TRAP transporter small permease subunit [Kangiellaceae bacterium]